LSYSQYKIFGEREREMMALELNLHSKTKLMKLWCLRSSLKI